MRHKRRGRGRLLGTGIRRRGVGGHAERGLDVGDEPGHDAVGLEEGTVRGQARGDDGAIGFDFRPDEGVGDGAVGVSTVVGIQFTSIGGVVEEDEANDGGDADEAAEPEDADDGELALSVDL